MSNFIKALSLFVGTMIGVGIFGLPYVASKSGFFVLLFYFLFIGTVGIVIHLIIGDVIVGTKEKHRFPGYVYKYLGKRWGRTSLASMCFGLFGAQLAYLIIGGTFLQGLTGSALGPNILIYVLIFFILGSFLIYRGIKGIALTSFLILLIFFGLLLFLCFKAIPAIQVSNFFNFDFNYLILPYGIVVFALWSSAILPEVKEILKGSRKELRKIIYSGFLVSAITYLLFVSLVFGVSGNATSQDAFSGLVGKMGSGVIYLGFVFGLITCFSSLIALGLTLKKIFLYDMHMSKNISWLISAFVPLILFLVGLRQFIQIVSLTGALSVGLEGFIVILLYRTYLKKKYSRKMNPAYFLLSLFFFFGVIAQVFYMFFK